MPYWSLPRVRTKKGTMKNPISAIITRVVRLHMVLSINRRDVVTDSSSIYLIIYTTFGNRESFVFLLLIINFLRLRPRGLQSNVFAGSLRSKRAATLKYPILITCRQYQSAGPFICQ
jgi:hypothetical protein